jgi:hypothetical protein
MMRKPYAHAARGSSLLEILIALPLVALLGIVAVQLLLSVNRTVIRTDGALGATRELRHGASVLSSELRGIRPTDLVAWADTAVEFEATVGTGVTCAISADRMSIDIVASDADAAADVTSNGADALAATWNQPPQPGDRALVWMAGPTPADSLRGAELTVRTIAAGTACALSRLAGARGAASERVELTAPMPGSLATGTPLRLVRRTRYSLYRASDGDWFLGRRTRGATGWDVIQPVAGPLLSARAFGMVVTVRDTVGALLSDPLAGTAARLGIALRAPRKAGRASTTNILADSTLIEVALRAARGGGS